MSNRELRASDEDRERMAELLRRAQAEGRITLAEFDQRVGAAYAARTYADLDPLTEDLPAPPLASRAPGPAGVSGSAGAPGPAGVSGLTRAPGPAGAPVSTSTGGGAARRRRGDGWALARRVQWAAWGFASLVNVAVWIMVSIASAAPVYPWWVWVAGPWGAALVAQSLVAGMVRRGPAAWHVAGCRGSYPV